MAESADVHPTAGRRRREKGPPSELALPRLERVNDTECEHSDDSAGEKEAKRQRSEPSTPVSTPRRLPYEYDALMGITKVGTREAEGFDEDLDSAEYHDANDTNDDPTRKGEADCVALHVKCPAGFGAVCVLSRAGPGETLHWMHGGSAGRPVASPASSRFCCGRHQNFW